MWQVPTFRPSTETVLFMMNNGTTGRANRQIDAGDAHPVGLESEWEHGEVNDR